jgi:hypothetical protein
MGNGNRAAAPEDFQLAQYVVIARLLRGGLLITKRTYLP